MDVKFIIHISYQLLLIEQAKEDRKFGACTTCVTRELDAGLLVERQEENMPIASYAH
jgi:hypothetical protein